MNTNDLTFVVNSDKHDDGIKTVLNQTGNFNGEEVINILLEQEAASKFLVRKIYREFVNEDINEEAVSKHAKVFRDSNYELKPLLKSIFMSIDFYSDKNIGSLIKSPVELVISTY